MVFAALALLSSQSARKVDAPTLEFYQGNFVIRRPGLVRRIPIDPPHPTDRLVVAFRRNESYAVWDDRGLTMRHGSRSHSTRLGDFAVSPKLFPKDELVRTISLIRSGRRRRDAAALSGAVRLGPSAYFLPRWEDRGGASWAEALVEAPLGGKELWPKAVGRFEGLSLGYKPIDDRLFVLGSRLAIVSRRSDSWGVATYDPSKKEFGYSALGGGLRSYLSTGRQTGLFVEKTTYGTTVAGEVDLGSEVRKPLFEARENARFLDAVRPYLVIASSEDGSRLLNTETGGEVPIGKGAGVARAGSEVLVWFPADKPRLATLYRPERWSVVARWTIDRK